MMNTTFSKIWQAADTAWKYSKSFYQVEFLDSRAILPPPFRFFYYFAVFVRWAKWVTGKKKSLDQLNMEGTQNTGKLWKGFWIPKCRLIMRRPSRMTLLT